jgi:hypothetical protein
VEEFDAQINTQQPANPAGFAAYIGTCRVWPIFYTQLMRARHEPQAPEQAFAWIQASAFMTAGRYMPQWVRSTLRYAS